MHTPVLSTSLAALCSVLVLAPLSACDGAREGERKTADQAAAAPAVILPPVPIKTPGFPIDSATILGWVNDPAGPDSASIRAHAWALWAGLTAPTGIPDLPVFETWPSDKQVFNPPAHGASEAPRSPLRDLEVPNQFRHAVDAGLRDDAATPDSALVKVTVQYNADAQSFIRSNHYYLQDTLNALNAALADSPIARRGITSFPRSSVLLKPVYQPVSSRGLTVLPYWAGVQASRDTLLPYVNSWNQCVVVDPRGPGGGTMEVMCNGRRDTAQVVPINQFYRFPLLASEAEKFNTGSGSMKVIMDGRMSEDSVSVGDFGVLVGMHVATKEIGNWAWQTFWWTPNWRQNPLASDQPATVAGPFKNYAMKTAYYETVPNGPNAGAIEVTFNPYLETRLGPLGARSNCMSCHRTAVWPFTSQAGYPVFNGNVSPSDTFFAGKLKLDFAWSIHSSAHPSIPQR